MRHGVDLKRGSPVIVSGGPERCLELFEGGCENIAGDGWVPTDASVGNQNIQVGLVGVEERSDGFYSLLRGEVV
jgi:hypothetical protein